MRGPLQTVKCSLVLGIFLAQTPFPRRVCLARVTMGTRFSPRPSGCWRAPAPAGLAAAAAAAVRPLPAACRLLLQVGVSPGADSP